MHHDQLHTISCPRLPVYVMTSMAAGSQNRQGKILLIRLVITVAVTVMAAVGAVPAVKNIAAVFLVSRV